MENRAPGDGEQQADSTRAYAPAALPERVPLPPWDMYTVAVGLLCGFILLPMLVSNSVSLAFPLLTPAQVILIQQGMTLVSWGVIFAVLGWRYQVSVWPYLGLSLTRPLAYYGRETVRVLLVMLALMALLNWLASTTGTTPSQPYARYSPDELRMISLFAVLSAPFVEELVFRGFVQSTFYKVASPPRAILFTGLVFVLLHGGYYEHFYALMYVLLLGLVLGYWRERTQSVLPGMLAHLFNNVLASLVLFFA